MNFEIEEELLAKLITTPNSMKEIVITDDYFLDKWNKFIFKMIKKQYSEYKTIDLTGIAQNYKHLFKNDLNLSTFIEKCSAILANSLTIHEIDYYQELLLSRYVEHEILLAIDDFHKQKISKEEMLSTIHKYENMSINIKEKNLTGEEIYKIIRTAGKRINFRFKKLSDIINLQEHDTPIIAAYTGMGKSAFIMNLIEDLSDEYTCLLFNMEITENQVYKRLVGITSGIDLKYLDNPSTEYQDESIKKYCKKLADKKIKIYNQTQSLQTIKREIIRESKTGHVLVFIDHIGLMTPPTPNATPYISITHNIKGIRQLSNDYDCTIFVVSQLKRKEYDKGKPMPAPTRSDLRDSGELEQSGTQVIFLHDPYYENNKTNNKVNLNILIDKNRNGPVGYYTELVYNKENQRFDETKKKVNDPNSWRKE